MRAYQINSSKKLYPKSKALLRLLYLHLQGIQLSLLFILAKLLTKFINVFGYLVIFYPAIYPQGSLIFGFPFSRYSLIVYTAHISELFYSQVAFFKFGFKLFISHTQPLKVDIRKLYQNKSYFKHIMILTLKLLLVYNTFDKSCYKQPITTKKDTK